MKLKMALVWLSGALFIGGAWQLEIVQLRAIHGEPYGLPFFLITTSNFTVWSMVWLSFILISYVLFVMSTQISWEKKNILGEKKNLIFLSFFLFSIGISQLSESIIRSIRSEPYSPPFIPLKTVEPMEISGKMVFNPILQPSFWGDIWMLIIILSYVLLLIRKI